MKFECCDCGEIFDEDDADSRRICLEEEYGVASMFPDRHYQDIMVCPHCGSEELDEYYEYEDEAE